MMKLEKSVMTRNRAEGRVVLAITVICALLGLGLGALARAVADPAYDASAAGRKPLVMVNGQTQQLQTADWLTTAGGLSTNGATPSAGDVQTTTITTTGLATAGGVKNTAQFVRTGVITPTLSAVENNYNPTGLSTASLILATITGNTTLSGLMAQPTGTEIIIRNTNSSFTLLLSTNSSSSDPANRFNFLFSLTLQPNQVVTLRYTGSDWIMVGTSGNLMEIASLTIDQVFATPSLRLTNQVYTTTGTSNDVNASISFQYNGASDGTITGFLGGGAGTFKWIMNIHATSKLTLANETGSAANRQIKTPGATDLVIHPRCGALLGYDGSYWVVVAQFCDKNSTPTLYTSTKNVGTITLAAGTGTATVLSGSTCVCSDTTAVNAVKCAVSATTLTATGTGTDVIAYHCF